MLIILSGCSGVGKNTVIKELLQRNAKTLKFLNVFVEPVIYQVGDELGRADILKLMAGKV